MFLYVKTVINKNSRLILATERERHSTTGKRVERTKLDFRCPICRSAIGQASCLICVSRSQLKFPFCCQISLVPWIRRVLKSNKCRVLASLNEIFLSNRLFLSFMTKGLKSVKWRSEKETFQDHTRESIHIVVVTSSPKNAWSWSASIRLETFVCKHEINILTFQISLTL